MSEVIESNNEKQRPSVIQFLKPSLAQVLLDLLVGGLLLTLINIGNIWRYLNNTLLAYHEDSLATIFGQEPQWLHNFMHLLTSGRIPQVVFWIFMGCASYTVVWFISSAVVNIRNDIVASQFIHPLYFKQKSYWTSILSQKFFLAATITIFLAYVFALFRLLPALAKLCESSVRIFHPLVSGLELAGALVAAAVLVRIFLLLTHIMINEWSTINNGL